MDKMSDILKILCLIKKTAWFWNIAINSVLSVANFRLKYELLLVL
jgi:hypothetical protein